MNIVLLQFLFDRINTRSERQWMFEHSDSMEAILNMDGARFFQRSLWALELIFMLVKDTRN